MVLVATPAGAVSLRLGSSACVTAGVESALSRNASGPRATGSPMHLMTTAAPTVGRSALDGFDTATLAIDPGNHASLGVASRAGFVAHGEVGTSKCFVRSVF